ncbi:Dirigent protein 17, partial [Linum grandiflorum]
MDSKGKQIEPESSPVSVFKLPGEPAVVINGVPDIVRKNELLSQPRVSECAESQGDGREEIVASEGFGEWLEGRQVQKWFGDKYFSGTVTRYDKETKWYRVEYEDGDFEDLYWKELELDLLPLDITVPLKTLASNVLSNSQKAVPKVWKTQGAAKAKRTKEKELTNASKS